MNKDKTKLLINSEPVTIKINNQPLEYVPNYIYLGQIISHKDQTTKEIERKIGNGWKKFWSKKEVLKSKEMNMQIKRKVFNTCILPVISYGCDTWALTKHHREKLKHCQRAIERRLTGIKKQDRVSKTISDWYPRDGRRSRGCKQTRWEDELKVTAGFH